MASPSASTGASNGASPRICARRKRDAAAHFTTTSDERYVLKIANAAEDRAMMEAENLARKDSSPISGAAPGFDFALDNSEQEQAAWIVNGFQMLRRLGYVRFGIVFNLDFIQKIGQNPDEPGGDPALYSVIRQNGAPRPAFEAIRDMPRR